jgi:hypothetical protein
MDSDVNTVVFLTERCRCRPGAFCFHRRPLRVLRRFSTGRLLVDNGVFVRAVDPQQVRTAP